MKDLILVLGHDHPDAPGPAHKDVVQDHDLDPREMVVLDEVEGVTHAVDHLDPDHEAVHHDNVPDGHLCPIESDTLEIE